MKTGNSCECAVSRIKTHEIAIYLPTIRQVPGATYLLFGNFFTVCKSIGSRTRRHLTVLADLLIIGARNCSERP